MGFPVFFDTCALYGEVLCDLFLCLAEDRLYTPYWSEGVLDELERVLAAGPVESSRARRRVDVMQRSFPDATIEGYGKLVSMMTCDEGDRHVLAAAVCSPAQTLVTFNLKDFPATAVKNYNIEIRSPDDFLLDVLDMAPGRVARVCFMALQSYKRFPQNPKDYALCLRKSGVARFAQELYPLLDTLFEG